MSRAMGEVFASMGAKRRPTAQLICPAVIHDEKYEHQLLAYVQYYKKYGSTVVPRPHLLFT